MIETERKSVRQFRLNGMHFPAVIFNRLTGLGSGQFCRGSVFICCAQEQNFITARAGITGVKVGWKLAADQIAEVFDPVDVGDRGCNQISCHSGAPVTI